MGRRTLSLAAAALLMLGSAVPVLAAEGDPGKVMIMKHACTEEPVKNQADFDAIIAKAGGDEITALALTVLACPTIVLTADGDAQTDGVKNPPVDFDFTVTDSGGFAQTLADAEFMSAKLCETDIERDANGDGEFTADVCLDISHYVFSNVAVGDVTIKESTPPNGWKFGTMLLTPKALQAETSDDAKTGADFDAASSTVTLDLAGDTDNDVMLHIYNFENSPATDTIATDTGSSPLAIGFAALAALGLLGGALAVRRAA